MIIIIIIKLHILLYLAWSIYSPTNYTNWSPPRTHREAPQSISITTDTMSPSSPYLPAVQTGSPCPSSTSCTILYSGDNATSLASCNVFSCNVHLSGRHDSDTTTDTHTNSDTCSTDVTAATMSTITEDSTSSSPPPQQHESSLTHSPALATQTPLPAPPVARAAAIVHVPSKPSQGRPSRNSTRPPLRRLRSRSLSPETWLARHARASAQVESSLASVPHVTPGHPSFRRSRLRTEIAEGLKAARMGRVRHVSDDLQMTCPRHGTEVDGGEVHGVMP